MPGLIGHVVSIASRAAVPTSALGSEDLEQANPKHVMIAQLFLAMLKRPEILPLLERAATLSDLKMLLMADEFFARVADEDRRSELSQALQAPDVPLGEIVRLVALGCVGDAYLQSTGRLGPDRAAEVLFTVDTVARELGVPLARVLTPVADGRAEAVLCLTRDGLDRVRDDLRREAEDQA